MVRIILISALFIWPALAFAAIQSSPVTYEHEGTLLEGYLAFDDTLEGKRPGILVVHEWKGLNEYAKGRAKALAQLGYVALAIDMYGQGIQANDHQEAAALSGVYRSDRALMRSRAKAGLEVLKLQENVNTEQLGAIGFCFGGTTVLELARSGEPLKAVVTFHGGLDTPHIEDAKNIKGKILVLHGADDGFVTQEQLQAFESEMTLAGVDYSLIQYQGAVHSFTVPEAGNDPSTGIAYHPEAARRSWAEMKKLFDEVLK